MFKRATWDQYVVDVTAYIRSHKGVTTGDAFMAVLKESHPDVHIEIMGTYKDVSRFPDNILRFTSYVKARI